jgi:hypothetical protein
MHNVRNGGWLVRLPFYILRAHWLRHNHCIVCAPTVTLVAQAAVELAELVRELFAVHRDDEDVFRLGSFQAQTVISRLPRVLLVALERSQWTAVAGPRTAQPERSRVSVIPSIQLDVRPYLPSKVKMPPRRRRPQEADVDVDVDVAAAAASVHTSAQDESAAVAALAASVASWTAGVRSSGPPKFEAPRVCSHHHLPAEDASRLIVRFAPGFVETKDAPGKVLYNLSSVVTQSADAASGATMHAVHFPSAMLLSEWPDVCCRDSVLFVYTLQDE